MEKSYTQRGKKKRKETSARLPIQKHSQTNHWVQLHASGMRQNGNGKELTAKSVESEAKGGGKTGERLNYQILEARSHGENRKKMERRKI